MTARDRRIAKAKALYPDTWRRINSVCAYAAFAFDLEDHVARIVLACQEGAT